MTAVALAAIVLAAGLGAGFAAFAYRAMQRTDDVAGERVRNAEQQLELERARFERDVAKADAEQAALVAQHLSEELRHALDLSVVGDGLAGDDVGNRVLRFYERFAADRAARGGALPAGAGETVPDPDGAVAGGGPATTPT